MTKQCWQRLLHSGAAMGLVLATVCGLPTARAQSVTASGDISPVLDPNPSPSWNVGSLRVGGGDTGYLWVSAGGTVNVGGGTVIASGPATLDPSTVTVSGERSSLTTSSLQVGLPANGGGFQTGQLIIKDGGRVSSSTPVTINQGSALLIGQGGKAGDLSTGYIQNYGLIEVDITDRADFYFSIEGPGELVKKGPGTLYIIRYNPDAGPTTVYKGRLEVGGSVLGNAFLGNTVTVRSGGSIGGSFGGVGGLIVESGGRLAPGINSGNPIGTLSVRNDLVLASGSVFEVQVGEIRNDRIYVVGTATLDGGKVEVVASPYLSFQNEQTYQILFAGRGITGSFDPFVLSHSAFLDATLLQGGHLDLP